MAVCMISAHVQWPGSEDAGLSSRIVSLNWAWESPGRIVTVVMAWLLWSYSMAVGTSFSSVIYWLIFWRWVLNQSIMHARHELYHSSRPHPCVSGFFSNVLGDSRPGVSDLFQGSHLWHDKNYSQKSLFKQKEQLWTIAVSWGICPNSRKIAHDFACDVGQEWRLQLP
jgi:hypothetical protein